MKPLYGPPPDPAQLLIDTHFFHAPVPWIFSLFVGILVAYIGYRRNHPLLGITGAVITLTTPFLWYLPSAVYGSYPTIDKAGSISFYLQGVQWHFSDNPALRLIGVHLGHLWVSALFDILLEPFAAFNAQGLMNLVLGWYCTFRLFECLGARRPAALLAAFPFGMGLHVFRDLNWYTIEKSSVFWIPLYAEVLLKTYRSGGRWMVVSGVVFGVAFFMNAYWSMVCGAMVAWALVCVWMEERWSVGVWRIAGALGMSLLGGAPLAIWQAMLMTGERAIATPEAFGERAALDVVSLWPFAWNRMEGWAALEPMMIGIAVWNLRKSWRYWVVMVPFLILSLGPQHNPLYQLCMFLIPGFWRVAKPEVFFEVAYLAMLAAAALHIRKERLLAVLLVVSWILRVRLHPVYPPISTWEDPVLPHHSSEHLRQTPGQ